MIGLASKWANMGHLHYGDICIRLVGFKEPKNILSSKPSNLRFIYTYVWFRIKLASLENTQSIYILKNSQA